MRHRTGRIAGEQLPRRWRGFCRFRRDLAAPTAERDADGVARRAPRTPRAPRDRDGGFTMVEVVMTIVLISLVIIPIIDATFTSVKASSTAREVAELDTVLQNAADRVNRATPSCNYDMFVQAAALAKGWQASQASATIQYYIPGPSAHAADQGTWAAEACPGSPGPLVRTPRLIQKVTITVFSDSGSIHRSIQVVKSDI
jgi:type II secretory pathway pseudopilin PulG